MVGISEDDPRIEFIFKPFETDSFYGSLSANRHEDRRLDDRPARRENSGTGLAVPAHDLPFYRLIHLIWISSAGPGFHADLTPINDQIFSGPIAASVTIVPVSSIRTADGTPRIPNFAANL